jgi:hypothetical protein
MRKRKLAIFMLFALAVFVASRGQPARQASAAEVAPGAGAVALQP